MRKKPTLKVKNEAIDIIQLTLKLPAKLKEALANEATIELRSQQQQMIYILQKHFDSKSA